MRVNQASVGKRSMSLSCCLPHLGFGYLTSLLTVLRRDCNMRQYSNTALNVDTWQLSDPETFVNVSGDRARVELEFSIADHEQLPVILNAKICQKT